MKRILSFIMCLISLLMMCSCGGKSDGTKSNPSDSASASIPQKPAYTAVGENGSRTDNAAGFQLEAPAVGETVAVFETTMGTIIMRLFPKSAPITVTNFTGLIEQGYYNGIKFHRVINDFMIQGGDPTATGAGGASVWGESFEDEFNANLLNLRGSVSMANSGVNTNGSQFFINQAKTAQTKSDLDFDKLYNAYYINSKSTLAAQYSEAAAQYGSAFTAKYPDSETFIKESLTDFIGKNYLISSKVPDEVWQLYKTYGGNITLDGAWKTEKGHSVFAQVVIGMDVVDSIAAVEVDGNDKPTKDVVINKAYLTEFTADMLEKANSQRSADSAQ